MMNIDRHKVYEHLLSIAKKEKNVKLVTNAKIEIIDFEAGSVKHNESVKVYDWVFGCDGINSSTRVLMSKDPKFKFTKEKAGVAIEYTCTKPDINPNTITFYYGKKSYLACALSSRNDKTFDV
jgi:2-polyprenyl-6-methoxyphenol hydroxylase-like FAD-dependent oxidoreductase